MAAPRTPARRAGRPRAPRRNASFRFPSKRDADFLAVCAHDVQEFQPAVRAARLFYDPHDLCAVRAQKRRKLRVLFAAPLYDRPKAQPCRQTERKAEFSLTVYLDLRQISSDGTLNFANHALIFYQPTVVFEKNAPRRRQRGAEISAETRRNSFRAQRGSF